MFLFLLFVLASALTVSLFGLFLVLLLIIFNEFLALPKKKKKNPFVWLDL